MTIVTSSEESTNVKVGIVEVVANIPPQHLELLALQQNRMEPTQGEEQASIFLNLLHAIVGVLRLENVHSRHF